MKKMILAFIPVIYFVLAVPVYSDSVQAMHDAFARGFQALKDKKKTEAMQSFESAGQYAVQAREWNGCLDAGGALLRLGEPSKAAGLFDEASSIAEGGSDWKIAVAAGYAYASLPADLNRKDDAAKSFDSAVKWAGQSNDWIGVIEGANGLIHVGENARAQSAAADAQKIVEKTRSDKGAAALSKLYEKLGMSRQAEGTQADVREYSQERRLARRAAPAPPPGWSPVGESVAGPPVPSPEQQRLARESADREIEAKNQWILQQEQLDLEREKTAAQYSQYYYYPYGYSSYEVYQPWGWDMLIPWAETYSANYVYADGHYHHHGSYTGFGFDFGYADDNTFFGFSLYSSDY